MNLLYIGAGFVGSCSGAVSADSGHNVLLYDIDVQKITTLASGDANRIETILHEDGLASLLKAHKERITFSSDYADVEKFLETCDAVFLCVATPEIDETGESNLTFYRSALLTLATALTKRNQGTQSHYVVVVNKSTVPIIMIDETEQNLKEAGVINFGVVSNPEFLVEGKAISGSLKPDRIVVGASKEEDFAIMRQVYGRFYTAPDVDYIEVNPHEAAAGKLLANYYLFNKLAVCFDVIGRTCEAFPSLSFEHIRQILTTDKRIGSWGLYNSAYAGGSCFIKDARSLAHQLQSAGASASLVNETYLANRRQLELFLARPEKELDWQWQGKVVALLGTAFKRDTNDVRNSPSIDMVRFWQKRGVRKIVIYDPSALPMFSQLFPASDVIAYATHEFEAVEGADAVCIATDWPQFRGLADMIMAGERSVKLVMDGRRMLAHRYRDLQLTGFNVVAVGSPVIRALN